MIFILPRPMPKRECSSANICYRTISFELTTHPARYSISVFRSQYYPHAIHRTWNLLASRGQKLALDRHFDRSEVAAFAIALGPGSKHSRQIIPLVAVLLDDQVARTFSLFASCFLPQAA